MMLTLRRIFLGLNGMAINGKQVDIKIVPEFNKFGTPIATKWFLSGAQFDDETVCLKDYLAGIHIDEIENDVPIKFYDATSKYARFITDRTSNVNVPKHGKRTSKSAFKMLLEIIQACINDIDDTVLDILLDERITRGKCKIIYPLLREIPDDVQTPEQLLQNFISLARPGENVVRYWKKILVLNNRRFWISNHIFKINITPFKELMSDLTGIELVNFNPMNSDSHNIETDNELLYAETMKKEMLILFNKFQQHQISFEEYLTATKQLNNKYSIEDFNNSFATKNNDNNDDNIENSDIENDDIENSDIETDNNEVDDTENLSVKVDDSNELNNEDNIAQNDNTSRIEDLMKSTFGFFN